MNKYNTQPHLPPAPKFSRQTYEMVAGVLNVGDSPYRDRGTVELMMWEFAGIFRRDNPRFDEKKFQEAVEREVY